MAKRLERKTADLYRGPAEAPAPGADRMFGLTGALPQVIEADLDWIDTRPDQPRRTFDDEALQSLALSIREHGLKQPVLVRHEASGRYTLLAGERRLRAHRINGARTIVAIVANESDSEVTALLENTQRADLNAVELAMAVARLLERPGYTQAKVAPLVGLTSHTQVSRLLRILKLPKDILDEYLVHAGTVSRATLVEIAEADPALQRSLWERAKAGLGSTAVRAAKKAPKAEFDGHALRVIGQTMLKMNRQVQTLEQHRALLSKEHLDGLRALRDSIDTILAGP
ncbi:MAG TPA: ParB/RepB/Spo0J family partition protein [Azospirillum sp.]|nr:ParB/RepB/Spo0J family partition protein [Azospirillum sp.]